jgi:hypothetical protein
MPNIKLNINPERLFIGSVATLALVLLLGILTKARLLFVLSDILVVFILLFALVTLVWSLIKRSNPPNDPPAPPEHPSES